MLMQINLMKIQIEGNEGQKIMKKMKTKYFEINNSGNTINLDSNEYNNCINIRNNLDYVFKTEILVRPYYSKEQEEQN